jgi:hypothetical protein
LVPIDLRLVYLLRPEVVQLATLARITAACVADGKRIMGNLMIATLWIRNRTEGENPPHLIKVLAGEKA